MSLPREGVAREFIKLSFIFADGFDSLVEKEAGRTDISAPPR
jgi:hypothetical protein